MSMQDLFDMASESYQKARDLVAKMNAVVSKANSKFSPEVSYIKLDIIIQYLLLETSIADGKFSPIEGDFIDKITDSFDIIDIFENAPKGMNWKWFAEHRSFTDIKNTIGKLRKAAQKQMSDFAELFAIVDAATENYDILGELLGYLGEIAGCFSRIDGSHDEREVNVATNIVSEYLAKPWLEMMEEVNK